MADCSIDFICTDPPYALTGKSGKGGFMGKEWDSCIPGVEFWAEMLRICKPGSMLAAFGGTRTFHRLTCAIEDAGWEIRDCICFLYGSGFPKSHNKFGFEGYGTALKPAWEPIILAMKPLDGTYAQNAEKWGLAGINIEESRVGSQSTLQFKKGGRNQFPHEDDSWTPKDVLSGSENGRWPANLLFDEQAAEMLDQMSGNNVSRFFKVVDNSCFLCYNPYSKAKDKECNHTHVQPAQKNLLSMSQTKENIVLENAQMTQDEQFVQNVKYAGNLCDLCATNIAQGLVKIKNLDFKIEELQATLDYIGSFKKCILIQNLALFAEQWENIDTIPTIQSLLILFGCVHHAIENYTKQESHNQNGKKELLRSIYTPKASSSERNAGLDGMELKNSEIKLGLKIDNNISTGIRTVNMRCNHHPTVKPLSLMRYIIKLLAPPGNPILLDPFAGSGSTIIAAKQLGIKAIGIELSEEYCEIARKRLEHWKEFDPELAL